jgi:hypothetical protein
MRTTVSSGIVAAALTAALSAQIPERAEWEITFAQVEAAARLSDLRTAGPKTFEARLMMRPWSAMAPLPFLRLVGIDGAVTAQLFVFWAPARMAPVQRPQGTDIMCLDGVCVRPVDNKEQRDWAKVAASLASVSACPTKNDSNVVRGCADCEHLWIKTAVEGQYREQSCNYPGSETSANSLLQLMQRSARAAGYLGGAR